MATQGETQQFTARLELRMFRAIKRLADKEGVSINEKLNEFVELGLIAYVARKKKAGTQTPAS